MGVKRGRPLTRSKFFWIAATGKTADRKIRGLRHRIGSQCPLGRGRGSTSQSVRDDEKKSKKTQGV